MRRNLICKALLTVFMMAAMAAMAGTAVAAEVIVIRFSHVVSADAPKGRAAENA